MQRIIWHDLESEAVTLLQRYLQIDTSNPPGNEMAAAEFLSEQIAPYGVHPVIQPIEENRANLIAHLPASGEPQHPPLLLVHHLDVVPANAEKWRYPPFRGVLADGYVYGRGALDIKSLGIMHLLALKAHLQQGASFNRDIYYLALADEEVSSRGAHIFLKDIELRARLHKATVWSEGGVGIIDRTVGHPVFTVAVSEKQILWLKLIAHGRSGHGSTPHWQNANLILTEALHRLAHWRHSPRLTPVAKAMFETLAVNVAGPLRLLFKNMGRLPLNNTLVAPLLEDPLLRSALYDTVSINVIRGGVSINVIPSQAEAILDCRLLPSTNSASFLLEMNKVIDDTRVEVEIIEAPTQPAVTSWQTSFFQALQEILLDMVPDALVSPFLLPGVSDARYFRQQGMDVYGILPIVVPTKELRGIHGANERISVVNLRMGTQVIYNMLSQYRLPETITSEDDTMNIRVVTQPAEVTSAHEP